MMSMQGLGFASLDIHHSKIGQLKMHIHLVWMGKNFDYRERGKDAWPRQAGHTWKWKNGEYAYTPDVEGKMA